MRPLDASLIKRLDLKKAALSESKAWRNLIPPDPWLDAVAARAGHFAKLASKRLQSGGHSSLGEIAYAKKGRQAVRPVPILGVVERIAYRALTDFVFTGLSFEPRDGASYRSFVEGPLLAAFPGKPTTYRASSAAYEYVVVADIAAFYQYVDHSLLLNRLQAHSDSLEAASALVGLLGEIQGQSFGLPQLLNASDELSEAYIRIMEQDLTTPSGVPVPSSLEFGVRLDPPA